MEQKVGIQTVSLDFPGDMEYVADVRRLLSNIISLRGYSRRFTFRMEIIIDELCSNAVKFGRLRIGEQISVSANIDDTSVEFVVSHPGTDPDGIIRLRQAIEAAKGGGGSVVDGRGIQIVGILCDALSVETKGETVVVARKQWSPEDDT